MATRLEDVAAAVGLKRAALFYHFVDKQALYDAVIANAFGSFGALLEEAFSAPPTITERLERAVEVWVDTITARPTLARLILRHAAEAEDHGTTGLFPGAERLLRLSWSMYAEGCASGELKPVLEDPFHAASSVIGTTVFYVAGFSALLPGADVRPLAPEQAEAHKRDALRKVRLLLGMRAVPSKGSVPQRKTAVAPRSTVTAQRKKTAARTTARRAR